MGDAKNLVVVDEYNGEYFINEAYRPIAQQLKNKFFEELKWAPVDNIIFIDRQETKQKRNNKLVCAQVSKIPSRWEDIIYQLTGRYFNFMIEVFRENTAEMSRAQIVALLYHEMRHIQLVVTKNSSSITLVGHEIEDWVNMLEKLGPDWATTKSEVPDLLDDSITNWDSIMGPLTLFPESNLRLVKS